MRKKILLFGGSGMLGRELLRCFGDSHYDIMSPAPQDVDITDQKAVFNAVRKFNPEIVVNAAVLVSVDKCESSPLTAYAANTLGPLFIADAIVSLCPKSTIFIQYSSADIFGSEFQVANSEDKNDGDAVNVYGRSKYYAEKGIHGILDSKEFPLYIIRASWIFSEFRPTFVDLIAKHVKQQSGVLTVVNDQRGVPTWGKEIAENTKSLIEGQYERGVYHFVSETLGQEATRLEVAEEIARVLGREDIHNLFLPAERREVFTAPRSASSAIINTRFPKFLYWRDALRLYLKENYI